VRPIDALNLDRERSRQISPLPGAYPPLRSIAAKKIA